MDKFIAIDVGQGDAFFLERDGKFILVDGGSGRKNFTKKFDKAVGNYNLDIIVCTHSDSDHISGLIGFFESGRTSNELWLPGTWTYRIGDVIENPKLFAEELSDNITAFDSQKLDSQRAFLERIGDIFSHTLRGDEEYKHKKPSTTYNPLHVTSRTSREPLYIINVDVIVSEYANSIKTLKNVSNEILKTKKGTEQSLYKNAINTVIKIVELIGLGYKSKAKIRWFEYSKNQCDVGMHGEKFLYSLNSLEINEFKQKSISALYFAALTKANVESLVFYSPCSHSDAGVLFSGDSDYSFPFNTNNISDNSLITSPHHGSESNANAYLVLSIKSTPETILVRSDSSQPKNGRPGSSYISFTKNRYCTKCRESKKPKSPLKFKIPDSGKWTALKNTNKCTCK
ncbi:TPA: MBL fold metallo-hydrolase [Serratia marcescens]